MRRYKDVERMESSLEEHALSYLLSVRLFFFLSGNLFFYKINFFFVADKSDFLLVHHQVKNKQDQVNDRHVLHPHGNPQVAQGIGKGKGHRYKHKNTCF